MATKGNGALDWGVAARPLPGEELCGDSHCVVRTATGWLLAVADGLGHGPEAATASQTLVAVLQHHVDKPPVELIRIGHDALRHTRGSAVALVAIDGARHLLSWVGVGNVEGVLRHEGAAASPPDFITMRGGIVGYRLPALQPAFLPLSDGDILILATDGIAGDFVHALLPPHPSDRLAAAILDRYAKPDDDALVLVARWHGPSTPPGGGVS